MMSIMSEVENVLSPLTLQSNIQDTLKYFICPMCSQLFEHPVTLPCGFTMCFKCLPRAQDCELVRFACPVTQCPQKVHTLYEAHIDVTIVKVLEACVKTSSILLRQALYEQDWLDSCSSVSDSSEESHCEFSLQGNIEEHILDELECQVCYMLLLEPITTQCGHTFCKECLLRSADHSDKCPICRHKLPDCISLSNQPQNWLLHNLIKSSFPQLVEKRQMAIAIEKQEAMGDTPLFVCALVFPNMPCHLHIFEPKYRLMIRRCLESKQKRFGMMLPGRRGLPFMEYGTMLEIKSVETLPDGRSLVNTNGLYRFRRISHRK
ncbi:hypothetical protein K7432_014646 [Basidiobolus ranarum]|uniref:RING-type domain-containing protein n=1 Tax=Basidiobolus ranarum TaxID=34480 RepID=A0ABR2VP74_9FUNG